MSGSNLMRLNDISRCMPPGPIAGSIAAISQPMSACHLTMLIMSCCCQSLYTDWEVYLRILANGAYLSFSFNDVSKFVYQRISIPVRGVFSCVYRFIRKCLMEWSFISVREMPIFCSLSVIISGLHSFIVSPHVIIRILRRIEWDLVFMNPLKKLLFLIITKLSLIILSLCVREVSQKIHGAGINSVIIRRHLTRLD